MSARALRSPAVWRLPVIMIGLPSVALPACYLSGITDPQANLRRLPVALVVEPQRAGAAIGLGLGPLVTWLYDCRPRLSRHPGVEPPDG